MGVCGLVESPLLTICSAEMRSFLERLMFMVVPFRGFSRGESHVFLWQRVVNKYSSGSSRCCGFVEKWKKSRSGAGVAVDKLGRVVRKLSTVYTDEEWMNDYPQCVHKNCGGLCTEICTALRAAFAARRSSGQIPLIWMVSDSISALVAGSSAVRFWIFLCAWMTVEWSRLKKPPMVGHETSVSSWQRYMAIWRG